MTLKGDIVSYHVQQPEYCVEPFVMIKILML